MMVWEKEKRRQTSKRFFIKRLYGVKAGTFHKMPLILQKEFDTSRKNGGKPPKLAAEDKSYIIPKILTGVPNNGRYRGGIRRL
ncbi:MAG: hypothetical protein LBB48_01960 [Treponema sp.]|jgi:hypothetical protein|nr:hypothetical protein [Treponema sp.]